MFFKTPGIWPRGATHIPGASKHMFSILWPELVGRTSRQIRKPERGMLWTGRGSRDEAQWGDREGGPPGKHTAHDGGGRARRALPTGAARVHQPWPSHLRQACDCPTD